MSAQQAERGATSFLPRPRCPIPSRRCVDSVRWPAPPLLDPPAQVRAIYVNAWAFGGQRFYDLVRLADRTEINAFVIDVKDDTGYLTYRSERTDRDRDRRQQQLRARDTETRLRLLREHGIHPIARIVVAKDPLLASRKPEWSVQHVNGGLWRDRLDFAWVDAFNDSVWIYASQLAAEAVRMGFAEVQYDYVRFPDEPESRLASAVFPGRRDGRDQAAGRRPQPQAPRRSHPPARRAVHHRRLRSHHQRAAPTWESGSSGRISSPPRTWCCRWSTPATTSMGCTTSSTRTASRTRSSAVRCRTPCVGPRPSAETAEIRPYLQAFTLGPPRYTPALVREQIRAAEELGLRSWVLWNPRSAYDRASSGRSRRRSAR